MTNDITPHQSAGVPDWARKKEGGLSFGNIDASDVKLPQLKLLAGQSPEVLDRKPGAVPGDFWITRLDVNLGPEITGTPILLRKTYQIWAPKTPMSSQVGPLATASDGINWDVPNQVFEVNFIDGSTETWATKRTVAESGLARFGSSQPNNPKSKPAAVKTYEVLWVIDLPDGRRQECIFISSRTGLTPTQNFISTTQLMPSEQIYQRYRIRVVSKTGPTGDKYFSYDYNFIGIIQDPKIGEEMKAIYDKRIKSGFVTGTSMEDEAEEIEEGKIAQAEKRMNKAAYSHRSDPVRSPRDALGDDDIPF